jgi:DNA-directed RNA polymerase specialized sigma24 family protein
VPSVPPEGSVSNWIARLQAGDRDAAAPLWERYFRCLVELARAQLQGVPRRAADEEDVAPSAFDSMCRRAARGQFPRLHDRDDLRQLLFAITVRKAISLVRQGRRARRAVSLADLGGLGHVPALASEPTPELAGRMTDECRRLLDRLGDESLRTVALWKMEGYTIAEIAARLGCVERSAESNLRAIRGRWSEEARP